MSQLKLLSRNRGSLIYGYGAMVVVMAILCATALQRSLETYHTSALAVHKLQSRAAAEGAAIAWTRDAFPTTGTLQLGDCTVRIADATTSSTELPITVEVHPTNSPKSVLTSSYRAAISSTATGVRTISYLELVQ